MLHVSDQVKNHNSIRTGDFSERTHHNVIMAKELLKDEDDSESSTDDEQAANNNERVDILQEPSRSADSDDDSVNDEHPAEVVRDNAPAQQLAIRDNDPFSYRNNVFQVHARAHISYFGAFCFGLILGLVVVAIFHHYYYSSAITTSCDTSKEISQLESNLENCNHDIDREKESLRICNEELSSAMDTIEELKEDASQCHGELKVCNGKLPYTRNSLKDMQQTASSVKQDCSNCQVAVRFERKDHEDTKSELEYFRAKYSHSWSSTNVLVFSCIVGLGVLSCFYNRQR